MLERETIGTVVLVRLAVLPLLALVGAQGLPAFTKLTSESATAFDRYVRAAESEMKRDATPDHFLQAARDPESRAKLRGGELRIEAATAPAGGAYSNIPGAMLQDWLGSMFIPNANIAQVKAALQDYADYPKFYRPEVIDSKVMAHHDDEYDISLRLYEKHILTVVLNSDYHVLYSMPDAHRMTVTSYSTRIAEVKNPKRSDAEEIPESEGFGFLWRLNAYWHFEEADGGVYAECRSISLSRDVPLGLGWMLKGFLERFPKESMLNTLRGTKAAAETRARN